MTISICSIASDSNNIDVVNTLSSIAIVTSDDTLLNTAVSKILKLSLDQKNALDPNKELDWLVVRRQVEKVSLHGALVSLQEARSETLKSRLFQ